uniref:RagB/SusD family nutrient uptake outer membrane protein n=1 Tax=Pedobacter schmidteae TaxID=2201271 RepID=UPI000EB4487E|nr:RagB/SusD family nutrient uptake outer membrane protein [Pedobacter schmidteae]
MKTKYAYLFYFIVLVLTQSCKSDFLDIKPEKRYVIPHTISDLQALMDNAGTMNTYGALSNGQAGSDDLYITPNTWDLLTNQQEKNSYIWARDIYENQPSPDWNNSYQRILYANIALEGLEKTAAAPNELASWNNVKGTALFYRGNAFYELSQQFCKPYDQSSAKNDPGIPLRLESDVNKKSVRATIEQTYAQILTDLKSSIPLLPEKPLVTERASKQAAYGLLARVYLNMEQYHNALIYADSCLAISGKLIDYNTLNSANRYPFIKTNEEVIFMEYMGGWVIFNPARISVDPELYSSYDENDLRKKLFYFQNGALTTFKGSYYGANNLFAGLAVNELYLIRSEALARTGNYQSAMSVLNALMVKRWNNQSPYAELTATDETDALDKILRERRKELAFRGLRWGDLRRLNKDPRFAKTITRTIGGQSYELKPLDAKYVLPIPDEVIRISGIPQNPR